MKGPWAGAIEREVGRDDGCLLAGGLGAVRATEAALGSRLVVQAPLSEPGDGEPLPPDARATLARTVGLALAGRRAAALALSPLDAGASLAAAVGKRLPLVLHLLGRGLPRHGTGAGVGHDDLAALAGTAAFQLVARHAQDAADLTLVAHRLAELSLTPGVLLHDARARGAERRRVALPGANELAARFGLPGERVGSATPGQVALFGSDRRRVPRVVDLARPATTGGVLDPGAEARGLAAQALWFDDALPGLADRAFSEVSALTGRRLARAHSHALDGARYVLVTSGSLAPLAEAVADHLRRTRHVSVGVVSVLMRWPFPADLLTTWLRGRTAVTVLERACASAAGEPPLLAMLRGAFGQALENGRSGSGRVHVGIDGCRAEELPALYGAACGLGGREPSPGDLAAAVEHMARRGGGRRHVVLGVEFARPDTRLPKLQLWQEQLAEALPDLAQRALAPVPDVDIVPAPSLGVRLHGLGRRTPRDAGPVLLDELASILGLAPCLWPDPSPERIGQPLTTHALLSATEVPLLAPPARAGLVIAGAPLGVGTERLLAGLGPGATLLLEDPREPDALWAALPRRVQHAARGGALALAAVDTRDAVAPGESPAARDPSSGSRHQLDVLLGAALSLAARALGREHDLRARLAAWCAHGERAGRRVSIEQGLDGVRSVQARDEQGPEVGEPPRRPPALAGSGDERPGHAGRFWERVGHLVATGEEPLADPLAALGTLPAGSSSLARAPLVLEQLPVLDPLRCSGCGECWVQCPDGALHARWVGVEPLLRAGLARAAARQPVDRVTQLVGPLARQTARALRASAAGGFAPALRSGWEDLREKIELDPVQRFELEEQVGVLLAEVQGHPLAITREAYGEPEQQVKGSGALLSLVVDPTACKGCGLCVELCPEQAFVAQPPEHGRLVEATRSVALAAELPDSDPRFADDGPRGLSLRRARVDGLHGGDGACAGCGEKIAVRQVLAVLAAERRPLIARHAARVADVAATLRARAAELVSGDVDLGAVTHGGSLLALPDEHQQELRRLAGALAPLEHLAQRTVGHADRAPASVVGAGGCSARWSSAWPAANWALPWVEHGLEHGPAVALGLFEGQLDELAEGFLALRRAEALLAGRDRPPGPLAWRDLSDEELALCPPVLLVGGDGALGDVGLSALSRLLDDDRPLRVVLLDNQTGSDCGGRPTRAGFGSDGAGRSELALLALAHRQAFVAQTSPAFPEHLLEAVRRGLASPHPALFVVYSACPLEHGFAPRRAHAAARAATASRAFPLLVHDPDGGPYLAERLDLAGNPDLQQGAGLGEQAAITLALAAWAATEERFARWLPPLDAAGAGGMDDAGATGAPAPAQPLRDWLAADAERRAGRTPFVDAPDGTRRRVAPELLALGAERAALWQLLGELAGTRPAPGVRQSIATETRAVFEREGANARAAAERKLEEARQSLPGVIARRLAEGLIRAGADNPSLGDLLARACGSGALPDLAALASAREQLAASDGESPGGPLSADGAGAGAGAAAATATAEAPPGSASASSTQVAVVDQAPSSDAVSDATAADDEDDEALAMDPYIESLRCTSCNECTNMNGRLFVYNAKRQATIGDPDAGSFAQLVQAAEKCPVAIIHPGTPRNPDEKDLEKWVQRAARFR